MRRAKFTRPLIPFPRSLAVDFMRQSCGCCCWRGWTSLSALDAIFFDISGTARTRNINLQYQSSRSRILHITTKQQPAVLFRILRISPNNSRFQGFFLPYHAHSSPNLHNFLFFSPTAVDKA